MKIIDIFENPMDRSVTYYFDNKRAVKLSADDIKQYGVDRLLRHHGFAEALPTKRVPVIQDGIRVGTVPANFDPYTVRSVSVLHEPRSGDFVRGDGVWIASSSLGFGDISAVEGFRPD